MKKELEEQIDDDPEKIIPISLDDVCQQRGFHILRGDRDLKAFLMARNYADFSDISNYEDFFLQITSRTGNFLTNCHLRSIKLAKKGLS